MVSHTQPSHRNQAFNKIVQYITLGTQVRLKRSQLHSLVSPTTEELLKKARSLIGRRKEMVGHLLEKRCFVTRCAVWCVSDSSKLSVTCKRQPISSKQRCVTCGARVKNPTWLAFNLKSTRSSSSDNTYVKCSWACNCGKASNQLTTLSRSGRITPCSPNASTASMTSNQTSRSSKTNNKHNTMSCSLR